MRLVNAVPAVVAARPGLITALDLPLKLLAWSHDESTVWLTYNDAAWLGKRHGLSKAMIQTLDFSPLLASLVKKQ